MDANFSRMLQKKREEQLEASRQKLLDSTASIKCDSMIVEPSETQINCDSLRSIPLQKPGDLDNSMIFGKVNKSWNELSDCEDSFLALERQCNMDDKHDQLMNANDTLLFDIEPPTELWNQTINVDKTQSEIGDNDLNGTTEISPAMRHSPLIVIEESLVNIESPKENSSSSATTSLLSETASTVKEVSIQRCDTSKEAKSTSSNDESQTKLLQPNSHGIKANRQRRGTFAFKRVNYTFFPDENMKPIDESSSISEDISIAIKTPTKPLVDIETTPTRATSDNDDDQFNNTLERVDFLLEKGKRILEETPVTKRSIHNSLLETPLFSCKRKRVISEMAKEMLPIPKRGPLIDFSSPEATQLRFSKFADK